MVDHEFVCLVFQQFKQGMSLGGREVDVYVQQGTGLPPRATQIPFW